MGRTVLRPLVWVGMAYARVRYGVNFWNASPVSVLAKAQTPVLLIHGEDDTNILPWHSVRMHEVDPQSELWLVPGAEHCGAVGADRGAFWRKVLAAFNGASGAPAESGAQNGASNLDSILRDETSGMSALPDARPDSDAPKMGQNGRRRKISSTMLAKGCSIVLGENRLIFQRNLRRI
jgi:hypothetical protein